jgi:hypothetical protein
VRLLFRARTSVSLTGLDFAPASGGCQRLGAAGVQRLVEALADVVESNEEIVVRRAAADAEAARKARAAAKAKKKPAPAGKKGKAPKALSAAAAAARAREAERLARGPAMLLEQLGLAGSGLRPEGARLLAPLLLACPTLRRLNLAGNALGPAGRRQTTAAPPFRTAVCCPDRDSPRRGE